MTNKATKITTYILLVLAVITVIGVIARFTNGFTSDFKTFYVTVDGKDIMISSGGYLVTNENPLQVDVKYTFNFVTDEMKDYSVKIVPNKVENSDFTYTVDGESKSFQSETDLTTAFVIDKSEKSFTVTPKGSTPLEILKAVYPESEVSCESKGYNDMFTVIVTSYNGESSVKLNFALERRVTGITFDKEVIEF